MHDPHRRRLVNWVSENILPHEPAVRAWLRRSRLSAEDIDDLIQEAYCKLAALDTFEHIEHPRQYFLQIVRHALGMQLRRARVVQFETVAEMDTLVSDLHEDPIERDLEVSQCLARVRQLIESLPERCRRIFVMRKLEEVPQQEIARRLGVSESVVENEGVKGMRLILQALKEEGGSKERSKATYELSTKRK